MTVWTNCVFITPWVIRESVVTGQIVGDLHNSISVLMGYDMGKKRLIQLSQPQL